MSIDLVGQILLQRYRVDALLGRGGMADVYRVWDSRRAVPLAMKVLREDLSQDHTFLHRFRREARVLESLQHPHVVRYYGLEQEDLLAFMLMDYIQGTTLRSEIFRRKGPFSPAEILAYMQPVCSALHYAHDQSVIHCDIKPANILLNQAGHIYVSDFGIARLAESATVTFSTPGTPAYMSPEQCRGVVELDARTDIYALGIVLYEMATGSRRPFNGDTDQTTGSSGERIRWQHLHESPPPPRRYVPKISPALEEIVLRCLAKRPADRYQSALSLLADLQREVEQLAPKAPTPQARELPMLQAGTGNPSPSAAVLSRYVPPTQGSYSGVRRPGIGLWMLVGALVIALGIVAAIGAGQLSTIAASRGGVGTRSAQLATATQATGQAVVATSGLTPGTTPSPVPSNATASGKASLSLTLPATPAPTRKSTLAMIVTATRVRPSATLRPRPTATATPIRSVRGDVHALITFVNQSDRSVLIYWVDYQGREILYDEIAPAGTSEQNTYVTHPWRVRDKESGQLLYEFVATEPRVVTIT